MARKKLAPRNLLVSSAGRRGELINILKDVANSPGVRGKVFAIDRSPLTAAGGLADGFDLVPSVSDSKYVDSVLRICDRWQIRHLVPTIDPELPVYSAHRDEFAEKGVTVWVSDPSVIDIASDKEKTHSWLVENHFPTVKQWSLLAAEQSEDLPWPLIAKPVRGSSSSGITTVTERARLKGISRSADYILQEIAPGTEYTIDVLVDREGKCRSAVPRKRIEVRGGEVSKGVTVRNDRLIDLAWSIAEKLPGAFGILNVQVFYDTESNSLNVIEINARLGGGFPLSWASGARMSTWLAEEIEGRNPSTDLLEWSDGVLMLRYDNAVYQRPESAT